jgi:serine/threonine protein phosphatase PrpC
MTEISNNKLIAFGASVTGSQHKRDRRPNEDAWMGGQSKFGTFIAISDGLGSKPNARQGAKMACRAVKDASRHWGNSVDASPTLLLRLIHILWNLYVLPASENDSATTCLFAVISSERKLVMAQLGDGLVAMRKADGTLHRLNFERTGFSNQTTGLGISRSTQDWQILTLPVLEIGDAILLATDGISEDLQSDRLSDFIAMLLTDFAPMPPYQRWQALCRELREFPVPNHLDDKTLAMLWRQP